MIDGSLLILCIAALLLTAGILFAVVQALFHDTEARTDLIATGTALLFALPALREAQPGIPDTPTIYDGKWTINYR